MAYWPSKLEGTLAGIVLRGEQAAVLRGGRYGRRCTLRAPSCLATWQTYSLAFLVREYPHGLTSDLQGHSCIVAALDSAHWG